MNTHLLTFLGMFGSPRYISVPLRKERRMTDTPKARIVLITCHRCGKLARADHKER